MTADLITWLRAQLDEDEAECRREIDGPVHEGPCVNYVGQDPAEYTEYEACELHFNRYRAYADPHRGLAEVEAKRRVLDEDYDVAEDREVAAEAWVIMRHVVALLALPYAARPGYREEWRP